MSETADSPGLHCSEKKMPDTGKKRMSDRKILATFTAAHIFDDIYMNTLPPFVPVLVSASGFSFAAAGLLVTFFTMTSSISQPLFGYVTDKYRLRWLGALGLILAGFFMGMLGIARSYSLLLLAATIAGLGPAMFHPHALSVIAEISTSMRGRLTSIFLIGGNLGFAIGPLLVGFLTAVSGRSGMAFIAIPGLLVGLLLWRYSPEFVSRQVRESRTLKLKDISPATILLVVAILRSWLYFSALSYIPSYFVQLGNTILRSNFYISLMLLAGVAGQFTGGSLSDKYGRKEVTMISLLASVPLLYIFLHTEGAVSMAFLFLFGFAVMSSFSVTLVMIQEIMSRHVGIASGIMIGFAVGLGGIGVLITGFIADVFGITSALHFLILLPLIAGILTFFIPYSPKTLKIL